MLQAIQPGMTRTLRRSLFAGASGLAVALSLGVAGTIALAWVLMGLAFKSNREGWDDRADGRKDQPEN